MNKLLMKVAGIALGLSLATGIGVAVGGRQAKAAYADSTINVSLSSSGITATGYDSGEERTWTQNGVSFGSVYVMKSSSNMQFQKTNAKVYNTTAIPGNITSIVLTVGSGTARSWSLKLGTSRANVDAVDGYNSSSTGWATISGSYTFFEIHSPTGGASYLSNIAITYSTGGQSQTLYTVSFDANMHEYTSSIESVTQTSEGGSVSLPSPTYADYTFVGWNTSSSGGQATRVSSPYTPSGNIKLYGEWTENVPTGSTAYHLWEMADFNSWSSTYGSHSHDFTTGNDTITVELASANKSTATITNVPVTKGSDVELKLTSQNHYIKDVIFVAKQWDTKTQTMTLHYSTNGGTSYTSTEVTSTNFRIQNSSSFNDSTNAIKISFSSTSNQVGLVKFYVTLGELANHFTVSSGTNGLTVSPLNLAAEGGDVTLTTAALKKVTNIQATNATISATNGNVITLTNITNNVVITGSVVDADITSIEVKNPRTEFSLSDDFEFGGSVDATYDDFVTPHSVETLDPSDYTVDSENAFTKGVEGTYTIRVTCGSVYDEYDVNVENVTYYTLVEDVNDLVDGAEVILVTNKTTASVSNRYAMTRTISSSLNGFAQVTVSDDSIYRTAVTEGYAYTLVEDADGWSLYNEDTSEYLLSTVNKKMSESATASTNWDISITNGVATIASNEAASVGHIMFNWNNGSARFTTYAGEETATMILPSIYQYSTGSSKTRVQLAASNIVMDYGDPDVTPAITDSSTGDPVSGCTFVSDNTNVATIVNGKVRAVGKGTATITVSHDEDLVNEIIYKNTTFTVTVNKIDKIAELYSYAKNTAVEFDGYYAGEYADGIVVMDGHYGMILYKATAQNGWTVDETVLHVTGTMTSYNNLIEVAQGSTVTVQDDASAIAKLSKPNNYTLLGTESDADLTVANRRTFVSGTLKSITASSSNYNVVVTSNGDDLALYLKAADNVSITLKDSTTTTISAYLQNNVGKEVTIKGFTSFYTDFQVRIYDIVETDNTYTAQQFAQQLLDATDAVCSTWDGQSSNLEALTSIWNTLGGAERWQELPSAQKALFTEADPDYENDSDDVLENAAGRYNVLCKKYGFNNFASRTDVNDAPVTPLQAVNGLAIINGSSNETTGAIITVVSLTSVVAIGGFFFLRKRRLFK